MIYLQQRVRGVEAVEDDQKDSFEVMGIEPPLDDKKDSFEAMGIEPPLEAREDLEAVRNTRIEAAEDKAKKAEAGVQKPGAEALAQKRSSTNARWCNLALDEDKAKEAEVPLRELDRAKIRALRTQKRSAEEARLQEAGYINGKPAEVLPGTDLRRRLHQITGCPGSTRGPQTGPATKTTRRTSDGPQRPSLSVATSWCQGLDPRSPQTDLAINDRNAQEHQHRRGRSMPEPIHRVKNIPQ